MDGVKRKWVCVVPSDVFSVVFHNDVDEVVDCCWGCPLVYAKGLLACRRTVLVSHQDLAVEDLVVSQDIEDHLLVEVLGRCLEGDFHSACLFGFEVDVAFEVTIVSMGMRGFW